MPKMGETLFCWYFNVQTTTKFAFQGQLLHKKRTRKKFAMCFFFDVGPNR